MDLPFGRQFGNNETTIMPIWSLGVLSLLQCLERRLFQDR